MCEVKESLIFRLKWAVLLEFQFERILPRLLHWISLATHNYRFWYFIVSLQIIFWIFPFLYQNDFLCKLPQNNPFLLRLVNAGSKVTFGIACRNSVKRWNCHGDDYLMSLSLKSTFKSGRKAPKTVGKFEIGLNELNPTYFLLLNKSFNFTVWLVHFHSLHWNNYSDTCNQRKWAKSIFLDLLTRTTCRFDEKIKTWIHWTILL